VGGAAFDGARVPSVHACQARLVSHLLTLAPAGVRASKQPTGILAARSVEIRCLRPSPPRLRGGLPQAALAPLMLWGGALGYYTLGDA